MNRPVIRVGLGKSLRRFQPAAQPKPCVIGGLFIKNVQGFQAESDGDPVCEALLYAIETIVEIDLQHMLETLEKGDGITDSSVFLEHAVSFLGKQQISHVAVSLEGTLPVLSREDQVAIRNNLAKILQLSPSSVGLHLVSGSGLTECSCGTGVCCLVTLTTMSYE